MSGIYENYVPSTSYIDDRKIFELSTRIEYVSAQMIKKLENTERCTKAIDKYPELEDYTQEIGNFYRSYYAKFGIEDVWIPSFSSVFVRNYDKGLAGFGGIPGVTIVDEALWLANPQSISREWAMLNTSTVIAHEYYHKTAPANLVGKFEGNNLLFARSERKGLTFSHKNPKIGSYPSAVEEGLAALLTEEISEALEPIYFSEQVKQEREYLAQYYRNHPETKDSFVLGIPGNFAYIKEKSYNSPLKLVVFLEAQFEDHGFDFRRLVERARLLGETVSLAKATESIFGKGSYRRIFACHVQNTDILLNGLRK